MLTSLLKTEAESLARALELALIDVADAVRWADRKIAETDVPPDALCDVSMSPKAHLQDVVHLLRSLPGECDRQLAVLYTLRFALDALTSGRRTPECVGRAMFLLALDGDIASTELEQQAYCWDDMFGLSLRGHVSETRDDIVAKMISALSRALADAGLSPITS
jgi:hypothetical protein